MEEFLGDYESEECEVRCFNNPFLISLFEQLHESHIQLKPVTFYTLENTLYRRNRKKDSQEAD